MAQYFMIQLEANDAFVLSLQAGNNGGWAPWVLSWSLYPMTPIAATQDYGYQQWSITPEGYIVNAGNPKMFLTLGTATASGISTTSPGLPSTWNNATNNPTLTAGGFDPDLIQQFVVLPNGSGSTDLKNLAGTIATRQSYEACLNATSENPQQLVILGTIYGQVNSNVWITAYALPPSSGLSNSQEWNLHSTQQWKIAPCPLVIDQWTTIQSQLSTPSQKFRVSLPMKVTGSLDLNDTYEAVPENTQAIAALQSSLSLGATWQMTADGYLSNDWDPGLVLTVGLDASGAANNVYVFAKIPTSPDSGPDPSQVWLVPERGVLVSQVNPGLALTIPANGSVPIAGAQLTMTPYTSSSLTAAQKWDFFPGFELQTLLVQPPIPFPSESPNIETIENALWPASVGGPPRGGLRGQYTNLAAPLASFQTRILAMAAANKDLDTTASELVLELEAAQAVQALFQQYSLFVLELTDGQQSLLNEIAALTGIANQPSSKVKMKWWQLGAGLLYTALNLVGSIAGTYFGDPGAGKQLAGAAKFASVAIPAIANLIQTTVNGVQLNQATNPPSLEQTYAQFQQTMLNSFEQMLMESTRIEYSILTDWRKLQIFAQLCISSGPDSLYWPSTATSAHARALLPGYIQQLLQSFLPVVSNFEIKVTPLVTGTPSPGPGMIVKNPLTYTEVSSSLALTGDSTTLQTYNYYAQEGSLPTTLFNYIRASVLNPHTFFNAIGGWSDLPITGSSTKDIVLILIQNATELDLVASFNSIFTVDGSGWGSFNSPTIGSYSAFFADTSGTVSGAGCNISLSPANDAGSTICQVSVIVSGSVVSITQAPSGSWSSYQLIVELLQGRAPWIAQITFRYAQAS
ncbi:hypothetical protein [Granulicella mallensis]|uniref:Uncharacterized protein n=1 Tax=Granulicella mallensis (strain ATCC BAA-1857 / DSM 23137 / MP5ACTX8) TaxID=682795 RepID=G8NT25_GRAMM|nr:hypothetical protein [Granulicella mallensis]AEU37455.1 hypothetical protein AciX8_3153 [Granulicella mallensis MP5ACTX8]